MQHTLPCTSLLAALALLAGQAGATTPPPAAPESRITQVKVYPGSATSSAWRAVAAGSRSFTFACLPAGLDVQSLQVSGDPSLRIGETAVLSEPRALSSACADHALDGRIRELEDRKAALQAERDALGLVTGYLKGLGGTPPGGAGGPRRSTRASSTPWPSRCAAPPRDRCCASTRSIASRPSSSASWRRCAPSVHGPRAARTAR